MRKNEGYTNKVTQQEGDILQVLALQDLMLLPLSSSIIKIKIAIIVVIITRGQRLKTLKV